MTGRLIAFVGPSGAGKDTLMRLVAEMRPEMRPVRRAITRPAGPGEDFEPLAEAGFSAREAAGGFALSWAAHGLRYGIPVSVEAELACGADRLVNLSRAVLAAAQARFPTLLVVHVDAAPELRAARLAARGREVEVDIAARLAREGAAAPQGAALIEIRNDGAPEEAARRLLAALQPASV